MDGMSSLLQEYIKTYKPNELIDLVKYFMSKAFASLEPSAADRLKPNHKQEYSKLRERYLQLLQEAEKFCNMALPHIDYAMAKLEALKNNNNRAIEVFQMLINNTSEINPEQLCNQCHELERDLFSFREEIRNDSDYAKNTRNGTIKIIAGATCLFISIAIVVAMPWAMPIELAIMAGGAFLFGVSFPSLFQIFKGIKDGNLKKDVHELSILLKNVQEHVGKLKDNLSDIQLKSSTIKIWLSNSEIDGLLELYKAIQKSVEELRQESLKPIKDF